MNQNPPNAAPPARPPAARPSLVRWLARAPRVRRLIPVSIRNWIRRRFLWEHMHEELWAASDPYVGVEEISSYPARVPVRLGILKEFTHAHRFYIGACRDMGVPYRLLDISGPDWFEVIADCGCDAFLVRPPAFLTIWKRMLFDERLRVMVKDLGKTVYPSFDEMWLYESKRRMYYWCQAHDVPHPPTWIFYSRREALDFCQTAPLPLVFKCDLGAGASGVKILRERGALRRLVNRAFKKGIVRRNGDRRDRQWGSVILQQYVPEPAEWRITRIGKSFFGYQKGLKGDFHSGSYIRIWANPPKPLLDFARGITETGRFDSMAIDILETADGRYLVTELQSLFGTSIDAQMRVDGQAGRYVYDAASDLYRFEPGLFSINGCCNLRVEALLERLGFSVPVVPGSDE